MAEITNEDGSRNWEANILFDNVKRLEQENAELKAYKDVNEDFKTAWEELKAENERLKEEIKEVKKYQYQQEYLDKEIEEMQKALKTLAEGLNKRQMILQKIKAIVCGNYEIIDPQGRKDILKLINKTEEE